MRDNLEGYPEENEEFIKYVAEIEAREVRCDYNERLDVPTRVDLVDQLLKNESDDNAWWYRNWNGADILEILTRISCPAPCKGYSTPPENWHRLCEARAQKAFDTLMGG